MSDGAAAPAGSNGATNGATQTNGATNGTAENGSQVQQKAAEKPAGAEVDPWADALKRKPFELKRKGGKVEKIDSLEKLHHYASRGFGAESVVSEREEARSRADAAEQQLERLRSDPRALREFVGKDWERITAEEALTQYEREEQLRGLPENVRRQILEAEGLKAELSKRQEAEQRQHQEREEAEEKQLMQQAHRELMTDGVTALQAAGFPKAPPSSTIFRLGNYLAEAKDFGLGAEHAAQLLRDDIQSEARALTAGYVKDGDADGFVKWIGEDAIKLIRKYDLARLRGGQQSTEQTPKPAAPAPGDENLREFFRSK